MYLPDANLALRDQGQPLLADWPYDPTIALDNAGDRPPALVQPPWFCGELEEVELEFDGIEQHLEDALIAERIVLLILEVTDGFWYPSSGVIDVSAADKPDGRHAVACVGIATHPSSGRCLLIKNSWGEGWGLGGYAWVTLRYVAQYGSEAATVLARP